MESAQLVSYRCCSGALCLFCEHNEHLRAIFFHVEGFYPCSPHWVVSFGSDGCTPELTGSSGHCWSQPHIHRSSAVIILDVKVRWPRALSSAAPGHKPEDTLNWSCDDPGPFGPAFWMLIYFDVYGLYLSSSGYLSSFLPCLGCCYSSLFLRFPVSSPLCLSLPRPSCVSCLCVLCCHVRVFMSGFHTFFCFTVRVPVLYAECLFWLPPSPSSGLICPPVPHPLIIFLCT